MHRPLLRYLANLVALKYMNYRTKRKRNMRKTKRIKGGTLRLNRDGSFEGVNNTGRADAYLLRLLRVNVIPRRDGINEINLLAFYENPEKTVDGFEFSFGYYYAGLSKDDKQRVKRAIDYITSERVNDTKRFLTNNPSASPDRGHANVYALTRMLLNFITLMDAPGPMGAVRSPDVSFNEAEKSRFKEIYRQEYELLLGPPVARIAFLEKFVAILSDREVPYERTPDED